MASVLSSDRKQDPEILTPDASWGGPIGVIRLGRIAGQIVVSPAMDELKQNLCNWYVPLIHRLCGLFLISCNLGMWLKPCIALSSSNLNLI